MDKHIPRELALSVFTSSELDHGQDFMSGLHKSATNSMKLRLNIDNNPRAFDQALSFIGHSGGLGKEPSSLQLIKGT